MVSHPRGRMISYLNLTPVPSSIESKNQSAVVVLGSHRSGAVYSGLGTLYVSFLPLFLDEHL